MSPHTLATVLSRSVHVKSQCFAYMFAPTDGAAQWEMLRVEIHNVDKAYESKVRLGVRKKGSL